MGQSRNLDMLTDAVERGIISKIEGIAELAFGLNANDPASFKQGWALVSAIKAADEHFQRHGLDPLTEEEQADVLSRFRFDSETETGAVLVIDRRGDGKMLAVLPWPGGPEITVDHAVPHGSFPQRAAVNWKAIGSVHPGLAEQFAKALRFSAIVAEEPIPEPVRA